MITGIAWFKIKRLVNKKNLLLLLLLTCRIAYAQIDSILALPNEDLRLKGFIEWATRHVFWSGLQDETKKAQLLQEAKDKFSKKGNEKLIREAWFFTEVFKVGGIKTQPSGKWEKTVMQLISVAEIAGERGWDYTEAECRMAATTIFFYKGKYDLGFEQVHRVTDIIDRIGLANYPEANRFLAEIGEFYHRFSDYETGIYYFLKAFNVPEPWPSMFDAFNPLNTLALCYQGIGNYDSAIYYFRHAYEAAAKAGNSFWMGNTKGNLGEMYALTGKDEEAVKLLKEDFESSKQNHQLNSAANSANLIAIIYLKKGDIENAKEYIKYANIYFDTSLLRDKVEMYQRLYLLNEAGKNFKMAYQYLDSMSYYNRILSKDQDLKIIDNSKLLVEAEKYSSKIKLLKARQNVEAIRRKGLIGVSFIICIIAVLIINRFRARKNSQLKTAALEKKLVIEKLAHAKSELEEFTSLLAEKNELLNTFKESIHQISQNTRGEDRVSILSRLTNYSILTDEDWRRFKKLFDKVYPHFFIRLEEKMPGLSASDTRLIALTKLKLEQKEIAVMLGIGYDAVRKARQRLRARMNIDKDISLEQLADMI